MLCTCGNVTLQPLALASRFQKPLSLPRLMWGAEEMKAALDTLLGDPKFQQPPLR